MILITFISLHKFTNSHIVKTFKLESVFSNLNLRKNRLESTCIPKIVFSNTFTYEKRNMCLNVFSRKYNGVEKETIK